MPADAASDSTETRMQTLTHFFRGAQSREETASAYLATLLDYDPEFRQRFLALIPADPPLDPSYDWAVRVEDVRTNAGAVDVSLEGPKSDPTTVVLIENKLVSSAKTDGQLLKYYRGAASVWPERRIVSLYLAPSRQLGASEVELVRSSETYRSRRISRPEPDEVMAIEWEGDLARMIRALPAADWFVASGIEEVISAIKRRPLPPDAQREVIRYIVDCALTTLAERLPGVRFASWPCATEEYIYKPGGMLTVSVSMVYPVDEQGNLFRDVVLDDVGLVSVTLVTDFGLRTKATQPPEVIQSWGALLHKGVIEVAGIEFERSPRRRFQHVDTVQTSQAALQQLIVERASQVVAFLRPRPELRAFE
jgi:PD-(D/E)XK nuclease superfamily